jgi:hypothetical protein
VKASFCLAVCLFFGSALTPAVQAQGEAPGIVQVSYWKCPFGNLGDAINLANDDVRPVAQSVIDDGMWVDWGILSHAWGDDWNLLIYTTAADRNALFAGWDEYVRRLDETYPDGELTEQFFALCPEHKDNIYNVVAPSGGDDDM